MTEELPDDPVTDVSPNQLPSPPLESTMASVPSSASTLPDTPWRLLVATLVGAGLVVWGLGDFIYKATAPAPPDVNLAGIDDPHVLRAVEEAQSIVKRSPRSAAAWGFMGMALQAHEFGEARICYTEAARLDPREARWPYLHAVTIAADDPEAAVPLLERSAELATDIVTPRLLLAELLLERGHLDAAKEHFERVLKLEPENGRALMGSGKLALQQGDMEQSLADLLRAVELAPQLKSAHAALVQVYRRRGELSAAKRELDLMQSLDDRVSWPDPYQEQVAAIWTGLKAGLTHARDLKQHGKPDEALKLLEELVKEYPDSYMPRHVLGQTYNRNDRAPEAEALLRRASELEPQSGTNWFELGFALQSQNKVKEAEACYRRAIELQPDLVLAHFNLSFCLKTQYDWEGALAELRETTRYRPDYAPAYRHMGIVLGQAQMYVEAVEQLEQALKLDPTDDQARTLLQQAHAQIAASQQLPATKNSGESQPATEDANPPPQADPRQ